MRPTKRNGEHGAGTDGWGARESDRLASGPTLALGKGRHAPELRVTRGVTTHPVFDEHTRSGEAPAASAGVHAFRALRRVLVVAISRE